MKIVDWKGAADCLRLLSHPHRLQVVSLLMKRDHSVGELAEACGVLQNVMSEHLTLMKHKGFITSRKEGRSVYYSIKEPALASIISCVNQRFSYTE